MKRITAFRFVLLGFCLVPVACETPASAPTDLSAEVLPTASANFPSVDAARGATRVQACAHTPLATRPETATLRSRGEPARIAASPGRVTSALTANTVLVYSDDFVHAHPNTFAEQALRRLGLVEGTDYTVWPNGDWTGLISAIQSGAYTIVLFDGESIEVPTPVFDALSTFVTGGGRLVADYWGVGESSPPWGTAVSGYNHALWTQLGVASRTARDVTPPDPLAWWIPTSPVVTKPDVVPPFTSRPDAGYWTYGGPVSVVAGFTAPAGYVATTTAGQAALVLGNAGKTAYRAFFDAPDGADLDHDGIPDGVELWGNLYLAVQGPCTPACVGLNCGSDGCGGTCGTCAGTTVCNGGTCCTPSCAGLECGDDGCGGTCGTCPANKPQCDATQHCGCTPDCTGKVCGSDGCGGTCGACGAGKSCFQGCCTSGCGGLECGADACGQPCGTCTGGKGCLNGACVTLPKACDTNHGPGCPGCACEACVCADLVDPLCCDPAGNWDALCAQECTDVCGGAACPLVPACGADQQCGPDGANGSCGTCAPSNNSCVMDHPCDGYYCNQAVPDGQPCTPDADPCTADQCLVGVCTHPAWGVGHPCTSDNNPCTADVCNAGGVCSHPALPNGIACNDNSACTTGDHCQAGACVGTPSVTCSALDACHVAGTCDPATGTCSNPAKTNGTACDDSNPCTLTDTCQAGVCTGGSPKVCAAQDQCHAAGTCDPASGACSNPAQANGAPCSDGNGCTQTDTCQAGACTGSNPKTCPASDLCHTAGTCNPATGTCSNPAATNGTACNDANACTQTDTCQAGVCTGSNPKTCAAADQCHNAGTCDPATGGCSNPAKADSTPCSDGNSCTLTDTCQAGACTGSNPKACVASDQCHTAGTCDPATGTCSNPARGDGTGCSDGNACTLTDTCQAGACTGSNAKACPATDACHAAGTCDPTTGTCSNPAMANGTPCNDGNACTQTDACQAGVCTGANPRTCAASDQCHNAGTCDPATGTCSNPAKANGTGCSDGNACTQTDTCQVGTCTGSNPRACLASDQCHVAGICDPASGTCSNPAATTGIPCNDGNACTEIDACQGGACLGSSQKICAASDACHTAGTCDPATGTCSNPAKTDGTPCNDGNPATGNDQCQGGICLGQGCVCGTTGPCCDGCFAINPGGPCSDGNACTLTDTCQAGQCAGSNPVVCAPSDTCHETGSCNTATGACTHPVSANDKPCNDGNACTQQDLCTNGSCQGFDPVACGAPFACHDPGQCDPATGTCSTPSSANGTACDDLDACTASDQCLSGACLGTPASTCTALDDCHDVGACDPSSGACSNPPKAVGSACDDGDACTLTDHCDGTGTCAGSDPVACPASDACHEAGSCDPSTGQCSNPVSADDKACDDGNPCTRQDFCTSGACQGFDPVVCGAPFACQEPGVCDPATGTCKTTPVADGTACNDGDACTTSDQCLSGACVGTPTVACVPQDSCHEAGGCDPVSGACSNPLKGAGAACDDGDPCTKADLCDASGACAGSSFSCPALGTCQDSQACDGLGGCTAVDKPEGTGCDDGDPCTLEDQCDGQGHCIGTASPACAPDTVEASPETPDGAGEASETTEPSPDGVEPAQDAAAQDAAAEATPDTIEVKTDATGGELSQAGDAASDATAEAGTSGGGGGGCTAGPTGSGSGLAPTLLAGLLVLFGALRRRGMARK